MKLAFKAISCLALLTACGEDRNGKEERSAGAIDLGASGEMEFDNALSGLPGVLYRSQKDSKINWQPWGRDAFDKALNRKKLVMALVVMSNDPTTREGLEKINSRKSVIDEINENYVPVLVDGGVVREWMNYAVTLISERQTPMRFPLLVWLTNEANPVAWVPLSGNNEEIGSEDVFPSSHAMVIRMMREDSDYVLKNSKRDREARMDRILQSRKMMIQGEREGVAASDAVRQLASWYDLGSRSLDGAGGLFPVGVIATLSQGVMTAGLSESLRVRVSQVVEQLSEDIVKSAMFDPLDGGVFTAMYGSLWNYPVFYKTCEMQAKVASCLSEAYMATGNEELMKAALGLLSYAEKNYRVQDGTFGNAVSVKCDIRDWMWTMDDLEGLLSKDEADVFAMATGMTETGNVPFESGVKGDYFKMNCLYRAMDTRQIAKQTRRSPEEVSPIYDDARKKILDERNRRIGGVPSVIDAEAIATFRMVSAYAAVYRATGNDDYKKRAMETMLKARDVFADGTKLKPYRAVSGAELQSARAFVYALAIQAALDVAAIFHDEAWLGWADDLMTVVAERFMISGRLAECTVEVDLLGMPLSEERMLFEESTAGLLSLLQARLVNMSLTIPSELENAVAGLPENARHQPIIHTDMIQGSLIRRFADRIFYGDEISEEFKKVLGRVSPYMASVFSGKAMPEVPPNGVIIIGSDGEMRKVLDVEEIFNRYLPNQSVTEDR